MLAHVRDGAGRSSTSFERGRRRARAGRCSSSAAGVKPREVYQPLRVAIAGTTVSPGIFESVALLGREETLRRIDAALAARA